MSKIKPCPFCGTKVELSKNPLWQGSHGYYNCFEFKIVCSKCGCSVKYDGNDTVYRTEKEATQNVIKAWNKRDKSNNKVGKWEVAEKYNYNGLRTICVCNQCRGFYTEDADEMNYCPHCGAKVRGKHEPILK